MTKLQWRGQLSRIALACPDVTASAEFYADLLGLTPHQGPAPAGQVHLGWGIGEPVLELHPGPATLQHFALEVPREDELEALVASARAQGAQVDEQEIEGRRTYALVDPEGRHVELHGRIDRAGEHQSDPGRRPVRLQHITLAAQAFEEVIDFYVEVLGLRISDRMGEVFAWLRCGAEHHTIAVVRASNETKIDHFSFDLDSWQDFKVWSDRLSEQGHEVTWGPGRHGPGNNLFIMFDDPAGYHIELSAEMEHYFDELAEYPPRTWRAVARTTNLWGSAPPWREPPQERSARESASPSSQASASDGASSQSHATQGEQR